VTPLPQAESSSAKPAASAAPDGNPSETPPPVARAAKTDAAAGSGEKSEYTYRSRVDEVNVVFTVVDKHGVFVKDLNADDFQVLDDNKPPKQVVNFSRQTDLPLRVGLLVDASNSIRERFKFEQEAAIEFLTQTIRHNSDQSFVIGFDTTAEVTADFTGDTEELSRGVRLLRPGGGTALYDAVYYACRDKLMKVPQSGPVRRAIVLLSDGDDNQSRVTREEAIEMAQRAEVVIYTISTNASGFKERGDKVLERMADATGGRAFFPFKIEDVGNAFAEIQDELRSQYSVAYRPASLTPDGKYHSIEILAQNHKNLKVRSRKGYFAPKD
jgi:VWFA-related protein